MTTYSFNDSVKKNKATYRILSKILDVMPEYNKALVTALNGHSKEDYVLLEELANNIELISKDKIGNYVDSFKWMVDTFKEELFYFMRTKEYRRSTLEEAIRDVYSNDEYMKKYMEGLLISQLVWVNHANSFIHFNKFLLEQSSEFDYLEIGPGHGLYLSLVGKSSLCNTIEAWDISEESIRQTKHSLKSMHVTKPVKFVQRNIDSDQFTSDRRYDVINISEVLEHLENPQQALENAYEILSDNGTLYINFPINSPAPDHIYLLRTVDEVQKLIESAGFTVKGSTAYPESGYSLQKALDLSGTISCIVTATR